MDRVSGLGTAAEDTAARAGSGGAGEEDDDVGGLIRQWNEGTLECEECGVRLGGGSLLTYQGWPLCEEHYWERENGKCYCCDKAVFGDTGVWAFEEFYHEDCLSCGFCFNPLEPDECAQEARSPYCQECYDRVIRRV
mmetsp:Transcript_15501/g.60628  ORF Transcript_15501/g.60628 Transcript_15501/m.60628 type:complete len:137 (+) Transcript_15501:70-480(+)